MMRRLRGQAGQTAAEFVGILLIVATIIVAIATSGIPGEIARTVEDQVCAIAGCDSGTATPARQPF